MLLSRLAALAGIVGPALLGFALFALTLLQWDFMRALGWDPIKKPTFDWPSGLALGPYGLWMQAVFLIGGALILFFGWRFCLGLSAGALHLAFAASGLGMMGLAFPTDPTLSTIPPTWHGRAHDIAFALLGFGLFFAWFGVLLRLNGNPNWRGLVVATFLALIGVPLGFILRGPFFYGFLALALIWFEVAACSLWLQLDKIQQTRWQ